jgi:anthranilate phosphoribosyltransferase
MDETLSPPPHAAGVTGTQRADATPFACAALIREIGRGKDGSRPLARNQAGELMGAVLDGRVSDLELGGILLALRMKGEQHTEIAGFLDAIDARTRRVTAPGLPVVVIPTYNGARHAANLVPLLAGLLARRGVPVLLHGQASDPAAQGAGSNVARVTTVDILAKMGIAASTHVQDAEDALQARRLAYLPLDVVCAPLGRLVSLRRVLGVRNVAHTLVKLLCPVTGPTLLLSAYTHPEFGSMLNELFAERGTAALLMRATEGEAVVNVRRSQEVLRWREGEVETLAERAPSAAADLPELPPRDADATAVWTQAVLAGDLPAPESLLRQCDMIEESIGLLDRRKEREQ